jgi:hypothetical protein
MVVAVVVAELELQEVMLQVLLEMAELVVLEQQMILQALV